MTPQSFYAVALRLMAIWFLSLGIITVLGIVTGPFSTLVFGLAMLVYSIYRNPIEQPMPSP